MAYKRRVSTQKHNFIDMIVVDRKLSPNGVVRIYPHCRRYAYLYAAMEIPILNYDRLSRVTSPWVDTLDLGV